MSASKILSKSIQTARILTAYLEAGNPSNPLVMLIHGNVSSNLFWKDTLAALSKNFWVIAPDLRGYGETERMPIDGSRGLRDWSDDLLSFARTLQIKHPFHLVGWSMGGGIIMQYAIDHPSEIASLTLINPLSPFGFGGTKDVVGTLTYCDYAGSGGGTVNADFVKCLLTGNTGEDTNSPRIVMNQFYFSPPFRVDKNKEDEYVRSMLSTKIGDQFYPGTSVPSENWPGVAPGTDGINNAMSPKYVNLQGIANISPKCPILWIRGANTRSSRMPPSSIWALWDSLV